MARNKVLGQYRKLFRPTRHHRCYCQSPARSLQQERSFFQGSRANDHQVSCWCRRRAAYPRMDIQQYQPSTIWQRLSRQSCPVWTLLRWCSCRHESVCGRWLRAQCAQIRYFSTGGWRDIPECAILVWSNAAYPSKDPSAILWIWCRGCLGGKLITLVDRRILGSQFLLWIASVRTRFVQKLAKRLSSFVCSQINTSIGRSLTVLSIC